MTQSSDIYFEILDGGDLIRLEPIQAYDDTSKLEPLERQLTLNITGDGIGHFEVKCVANDQPNYGGTLSFSLSFNQTELTRLINELDKITKAFPIRGDFSIKNE